MLRRSQRVQWPGTALRRRNTSVGRRNKPACGLVQLRRRKTHTRHWQLRRRMESIFLQVPPPLFRYTRSRTPAADTTPAMMPQSLHSFSYSTLSRRFIWARSGQNMAVFQFLPSDCHISGSPEKQSEGSVRLRGFSSHSKVQISVLNQQSVCILKREGSLLKFYESSLFWSLFVGHAELGCH